MPTLLPFETISTAENTECTVIWLHGLGADGNDFLSLVPELKLPSSLAIKFIFPHAPIRAVTVNNGMEMRAWYDLLSFDRDKTAKEDDILNTVEQINAFIDHEINSGTPSEKILLAGFSQGGVIALHAGIRYPKKLAGVMALSTYIPFSGNLFKQMSQQQAGLAVFAAHGTHDPVIPFASWETYVPELKAQNFDVEAHQYPMEHSLCLEEIRDISVWLQSVLTHPVSL
jgi:phospholipase/carboxylesterase